MVPALLIVLMALMLIGALPRWSQSSRWRYFPGGGLILLLLILVILAVTGRL